MLDRATGEFIFASPYARVTWIQGINPRTGRPIVNPDALPGPEYKVLCPSIDGGKSWSHMAYSPITRMAYLPLNENCVKFRQSQPFYQPGFPFFGGDLQKDAFGPAEARGSLKAIDAATGATRWEIPTKHPNVTSVLATAGGLVFWAEADGVIHANDAESGRDLWTHRTEIGFHANPITYAVDGEQYVAFPVGPGSPALSNVELQSGHRLYVFKPK